MFPKCALLSVITMQSEKYTSHTIATLLSCLIRILRSIFSMSIMWQWHSTSLSVFCIGVLYKNALWNSLRILSGSIKTMDSVGVEDQVLACGARGVEFEPPSLATSISDIGYMYTFVQYLLRSSGGAMFYLLACRTRGLGFELGFVATIS